MANKQQKINIEKLLQESESLIELERKLNGEGYKFDTGKDYLKFLESEWEKYVKKDIEGKIQEIQNQKEDNELPSLKVTDDGGSEYIIHGINHGGQIPFSGGWHVRRNVEEFINETMASFHNPKKKEDYFYEQNLNLVFDLFRSHEVKDHLLGKTETDGLEELLDLPFSVLLAPLTLLVFPAISFGLYLKVPTIINPKNIQEAKAYFAKDSLHNINGNIKLNNFLNLIKMPEPFNFEKEYLLEKSSLLPIILRGPAKTSSERSLFMAQYLKEKAEKKKLKKLHFLTGTYHVSEISYFLKNPNYSFDELEDYRKSRF